MRQKLQTQKIADFSLRTAFEDIGSRNVDQLKKHLLDSLGSMLFATTSITIQKMLKQLAAIDEGGNCEVPLLNGLAYDRAAQLYTALIRQPDFMDNFLGKEATCHPSDNLGALLATASLKRTTGKDFLTAMAVAYQIECRLVQEIPVMKEGIDHTSLLAYSIIAGAAKMLKLDEEQTANALGIAGCSINPLVTSRASYTYEWKGLASSFVAASCINILLLAKQGVTGPVALFEGPKGFKEVFDMQLNYDWGRENFQLIKKCILKRYNAEVHTQPAIEAALELKQANQFDVADIVKIDVTTFLTAYHIVGSGVYGNRKEVGTKEQADHSLFYLVAVALLDGDIYPEQFLQKRILKKDVQELLQKITVHTVSPIHKPILFAGFIDPYTEAYPDKVMTKVEIKLKNGKLFSKEKEDYLGFFTHPFSWQDVIEKFTRLTSQVIDAPRQDKIIATVQNLEHKNMKTLLDLINIKSTDVVYNL